MSELELYILSKSLEMQGKDESKTINCCKVEFTSIVMYIQLNLDKLMLDNSVKVHYLGPNITDTLHFPCPKLKK